MPPEKREGSKVGGAVYFQGVQKRHGDGRKRGRWVLPGANTVDCIPDERFKFLSHHGWRKLKRSGVHSTGRGVRGILENVAAVSPGQDEGQAKSAVCPIRIARQKEQFFV